MLRDKVLRKKKNLKIKTFCRLIFEFVKTLNRFYKNKLNVKISSGALFEGILNQIGEA